MQYLEQQLNEIVNQTALPSNVFLFPCISFSGRVEQRIPLFTEHGASLP